MIPPFQIRDVSSWIVQSGETVGSKDKDWLRHEPDSELWLYKRCRGDAGDDWAEKVAEQLASLLRLPHVRVELALREGERGIISRDFRQDGRASVGEFVHGNELLWRADSSYPLAKKRRAPEYTVDRSLDILASLKVLGPRTGIHADDTLDAIPAFVGYLLFDAWIGNLDRHHENWGILKMYPDQNCPDPVLAPTFDHGSSLGQNETDAKRSLRLSTTDRRATLEAWARNKAVSRFFLEETDNSPCTTMAAFERAAARHPEAARLWLGRLRDVDFQAVENALTSIPTGLLSDIGRAFTLKLLEVNCRDLLTRCSP